MDPVKLKRINGTQGDEPVAGTANVNSHSIKIAGLRSLSVSIRAKSSTGTPDLDIYLEQTHIKPVTEGEAIGVDNGWQAPVGSSKLADITTETWQHFTVSPVALPYMRLLLDGQGANPADCTVEIWITRQQDQ